MANKKGRAIARTLTSFFFDPRSFVAKWRAMPHFLSNMREYKSKNVDPTMRIRVGELYYTTMDRFAVAGAGAGHYFHQDLWAARELYERRVSEHVDVGSRIDGFVAHILPFCRVTYVDIRPMQTDIPNLEYRAGSITDLPFDSGTVPSLSCLHVIEHIGLGRYGDSVQPEGHLAAAAELSRVLAPGGRLLLGTPVGQQRVCFDAHRIFDPQTVVDAFPDLELEKFHLINDAGRGIAYNADFQVARNCSYGCGLFIFRARTGT